MQTVLGIGLIIKLYKPILRRRHLSCWQVATCLV